MIKVTKQGVTTHLWQLLPRNSFTWSVICYVSNSASLYHDVHIHVHCTSSVIIVSKGAQPKMLLAHPLPSRAYFSKLGRPFFFRSWVEAAAPSVRLGPLSPTTWETTCTRVPILLKRPLFFWRPFTTFQYYSKYFKTFGFLKRSDVESEMRMSYEIGMAISNKDITSCCCFDLVHLRRRSQEKDICIHLYWSIQF